MQRRLRPFNAKKHQALVAQMEDRPDPLDEPRLARPVGGNSALTAPLFVPLFSMDHRVKPGGDEVGGSHFVIAGLDPAIHADVLHDSLVEAKPEMDPGCARFGQA